VPYLTPDGFGETDDCRSLLIPATTDWLAIVSGALTELVKPYNWEQWGTLTIDECVDRMQEMIDAYYEGCVGGGCELPEGGPLFRLGPDGHLQELVDGEWVEPTGDYAIPPTEPRTEPTEAERECLAAANAVNALQMLYENLSDSIGSSLDAAAAAAELVTIVVGTIGLVLGAITGGLIASAGFVFAGVYDAVQFITADLWDSDFSDRLTCILQACASSDGDVVHFDFECVMSQLRSQTNVIDPTLTDIRLYAQIATMLGFLGAEGLDAAGATTAVETHDCDPCGDWCFTFDLEMTDADATPIFINDCSASYSAGIGWRAGVAEMCSNANGVSFLASINIEFGSTYIKRVVVTTTTIDRLNGLCYAIAFPEVDRGGTPAVHGEDSENGDPVGVELMINDFVTGITAEAQSNPDSAVLPATGVAVIKQVTFYGVGECPFGDPNCAP